MVPTFGVSSEGDVLVRSVIVLLRGGLGNQLHQFVVGWLVAREQHSRLVIDHSLVTLRGTPNRPQELTAFNLPPVLHGQTEFRCRKFYATRPSGLPRRMRRLLTKRARVPLVLSDGEVPALCTALDEGLRFKTIKLIDGYFASGELANLAEQVGFPNPLTLKEPTDQYRVARRSIESRPAVHVHIRLGDFVELGLAKNPEWYASETLKALHTTDTQSIRIFTDADKLPYTYLEAIIDTCSPRQLWTVERNVIPDGPTVLDLLSRAPIVVHDPQSTFGWWARKWSSKRSLPRGSPPPMD